MHAMVGADERDAHAYAVSTHAGVGIAVATAL